MRICILTQPLQTNYGGLLQTYALQTVLKRMGHEVWTEDRRENKNNLFGILKKNAKILLGPIRKFYYPTSSEKKIISKNTNLFIQKYINTTCPIYSTNKSLLNEYNFDAFIVGSDQVWRPMYSYGIYNYFLDFAIGKNVKRIAYAASFGTDQWEFTPEQTAVCSELIKQFDAISVREDSGISLCRKYLNINALQMPDPTLLLDKNDYLEIIKNDRPENSHSGGILTYILDDSETKRNVVQKVSSKLKLNSFSVMPQAQFKDVGEKGIEKCIYPTVAEWLQGFADSDFVVTDSFHGTVFSIIFNKPFIAIANKKRGISRFISLLKGFELEDQLIYFEEEFKDGLLNNIDFTEINIAHNKIRAEALEFLTNALK